MVATETQHRLFPILQSFRGDSALKRFFWTELNYGKVNQLLSRQGWPEAAAKALAEDPVLFAEHNRFHIIYARLDSPDLKLGLERPVVLRLLADHPYGLFVFSNDSQDRWHFLNVKHDAQGGARHLFRRITVGPGETLRTACERLAMLNLEDLSPDLRGLSALSIQQRHDDAFDVEKVTKRFFEEYAVVFEQVERAVLGIFDVDQKRLFTQRLFNRLMFIAFIQKKGWLKFNGDTDYLVALWRNYQRARFDRNNFYRDRLKLLFFSGLNSSNEVDVAGINRSGMLGNKVLQGLIGEIPYLNGGLFEADEDDLNEDIELPDEALDAILNRLFAGFNFTVTESTPLDVEVAVDPEMLGKVFEELVTGRHETGSYYTPKPVVSFMCRESLKGYLQSELPLEDTASIERFVEEENPDGLGDPEGALEALRRLRACDPACGSGAYLLGMLHELLALRACLFASRKLDPVSVYERKLQIIQGNLYGVDIDPFAVNIARLRLWLSLAVDFEGKTPQPLPNLDFKIEVGDSLLAPDPSNGKQGSAREEQIKQLMGLKGAFMTAHGGEKRRLRAEIEAVREQIAIWTHGGGKCVGFDWPVEFAEVFAHGGFDVVVMNPPYVAANRIPGDQRDAFREYVQDLKAMYGFASDLYVHFIYRALQLLGEEGMLSAITPSTFFTNTTKEHLRRELLRNRLVAIAPMSAGVFSATVYSAVSVLQKTGAEASDYPVLFLNLRQSTTDVAQASFNLRRNALEVPVSEYRRAFSRILFEPTIENRYLFGVLLSERATMTSEGRKLLPLGMVAPALDTGIHTGNVRNKLFYKKKVSGKQLHRLVQGTQLVRYAVWWENPQARYRYVDVDYEADPELMGVGRGGRLSGRGEYWHFCGPIQNHHVCERLLMRQTEDEPFVGYIYQGAERVYTDNTLHTLLLTDLGRELGLSYQYLMAILNSSTLRRLYRAVTQEEGRTLAQVKTTLVNRLPIPIPSNSECRSLEMLVEEIQKVYSRFGLPPSSSAAQLISDLQSNIDKQVETLYGLNPNGR
jgi:hypothetical protein